MGKGVGIYVLPVEVSHRKMDLENGK